MSRATPEGWHTVTPRIVAADAEQLVAFITFLYVYVDDVDATYRSALRAGAHPLEEPFDTPYGDRRCMVRDRWGNTWQIAARL